MSHTEPFPYSPQMGIMLTEKSRLSFSQAPTTLGMRESLLGSIPERKPGHYREFFCLLFLHLGASLYFAGSASGLGISTYFFPLL